MSPLLKRTVSGVIYVAIIVGCIFAGEGGVLLLAEIFAIFGGCELTRNLIGLSRQRNPALALDMAGLIILANGFSIWLLAWVIVMTLRLVAELYIHDKQPLKSLGVSMFLQCYLGIPLFLMSSVAKALTSSSGPHACLPILVLFILIWLNDTGAFLVGSMCGRHKMIPRISPKKTWEGFAGGIAFCLAATVMFSLWWAPYFNMEPGMLKWLGLGGLAGVFATWGDLVESLIKRSLGVKDSGHLIPGHGGILDRIDSFLLVMPAAAVYLILTHLCPI